MAVAGEDGGPAVRSVGSLQEALLLLAEQPTPIAIVVNVDPVTARDAPALHQILRKGEAVYNWQVTSIKRLEQLAKACICVETIDVAVLPMLEANPSNLAAGRLLQLCANDIRHLGRKVDGKNGDFKVAAAGFSKLLVDANLDLVKEEVPIDGVKVASIRQAMDGLKPMVLALADDEPDSGGGGGDVEPGSPKERTVSSVADCLLLYDAGDGHPSKKNTFVVGVTSVDTRHAPILLQLLRKGVGKYGWEVASMARVDALANLSTCLDTVDLAILPLLEANPMDATAGRLLRRYGRDIQRYAREVDGEGGVFHLAASVVSGILVQANDELVKDGVAIGEAKLAAARQGMEGLRARLVLLPNDEAGGGGDGGADE